MWRILRRVTRRSRYPRGMGTRASRRPLASVLAEVPGCWVAIDRRTNTPRAVADTPYKLTAMIRDQGLKGVAIVRAPDAMDPELVGLG